MLCDKVSNKIRSTHTIREVFIKDYDLFLIEYKKEHLKNFKLISYNFEFLHNFFLLFCLYNFSLTQININ